LPIFDRVFNTFTNQITEKIIFLHIPKCGGVSVGQAIAEKYLSLDLRKDRGIINLNAAVSRQVVEDTEGLHYPYDTEDDYPILSFREKLLLYFLAQSNLRFISGHFPFSIKAYQKYGENFSLVTVLRDPVKRWISSYFFNRFKTENHMKVRDDIETHLETHFGVSQGFELVKFLGGANKDGDYSSQQAINKAKENLGFFKMVGFLENLDDFALKFNHCFHVNLEIAKKNQSPAPKHYRSTTVTPELLERITNVCQPDIQVYEYAVENFYKSDQ
jgi:hypothetical protein